MGIITNRLGIEKPVKTDPFDTDTIALNWQTIDDKAVIFLHNTLVNRPAAGTPGRRFTATDGARESFYDTGTEWLRIPTAAPGGQHLFEKGTAAAPGLGFGSDSNTGIASLAADQVHLVTAGRWHWRVDAQGELGGRNFSSETAPAIATQKAGNSHPHWTSRVDGQMQWGPGNAAPDVTLYRDAAQRLRLSGALNVTGDMIVGGAIIDGPTGASVFTFDANNVNVGVGLNTTRFPDGYTTSDGAWTPGIAFINDGNTGFRRRSSGVVSWVGNGAEGGFLWSGGLRVANGTPGSPSISFINEPNSGMYLGGDGNVRISANSILRLEIAGSRTTVHSAQFRVPNGTVGAPGMQFDDPDTGFYHVSSLHQVGLSVDGRSEMLIGRDGAYIRNAWTTTTSSGANVNVNSDGAGDGRLRRVSSLLAHKTNIASLREREQKVGRQGSIYDRGRDLNPISFTSKLDGDDPDQVIIGMIAEWVADKVPELAVYDHEGNITSVAYDRVGVLALAYALDALDRLDGLEGAA